MLTREQIIHNQKLDLEIFNAEKEHEQYIKECQDANTKFQKENPDNPYKHLFSIPVKAKRAVGGIRYVE